MNKKLTIVGLIIFVVIILLVISSNRKTSFLNEENVIDAVIAVYPELAEYKNTDLPPSSIKTQKAVDGWYVGFIKSGSGIPGIRTAKCYHVSLEKNVVPVGTYSPEDLLGDGQVVEGIMLETCKPIFAQEPPPITNNYLPYGNVTLNLNQLASFKNLTIRPLSIEEDSRCPIDVQCIQAGTVRVKVQIVSGLGTSTSILILGQIFTTEVESITLTDVIPATNSKVRITDTDYRLVFNVIKRELSDKPA